MAATKSIISIRLTPKNPDISFNNIMPEFEKLYKREIKDYADKSKKILQNKIPLGVRRRVGRRQSTRSRVKLDLSQRGFNANIRLSGSEVLRFLDEGTGPSPGRYIPFLHRRLRQNREGIGMHPGISPLNIIQKTKNDMEVEAQNTISKFQRDFKYSIRTAFK